MRRCCQGPIAIKAHMITIKHSAKAHRNAVGLHDRTGHDVKSCSNSRSPQVTKQKALYSSETPMPLTYTSMQRKTVLIPTPPHKTCPPYIFPIAKAHAALKQNGRHSPIPLNYSHRPPAARRAHTGKSRPRTPEACSSPPSWTPRPGG